MIGAFEYPDGSKESGIFSNNKYEGKGKVINTTGDRYIGYWKGGSFQSLGNYQGLAQIIYANEERYHGNWQNGLKHGVGILTTTSGRQIKCEYENGELLSERQFEREYDFYQFSPLIYSLIEFQIE